METQVDDLASQLASPKNLVRKIVNENSDSEKEISADAFGEIFGLYQAKQRIQGYEDSKVNRLNVKYPSKVYKTARRVIGEQKL